MKTFQIISTFVLTVFFAATSLNAQWTNSGNNITTTDNVIVGTTNTPSDLKVEGTTELNGVAMMRYIYPNMGASDPYKYVRFGTPDEYFGGLMHNVSSPHYGDGDDLTLFTYDNRDIFLRPGNGKVYVIGSSDVNAQEGGLLILGKLDQHNIGIDNNEMQARKNGVASGISINYEGGDVTLGGPTAEKRVYIKSSGRIGFGTPSPAESLDIVGAGANGHAGIGVSGNGTGSSTIRLYTQREDKTQSFWSGTAGSGNKGWLIQSISESANRWDKGDFGFWYHNDQEWKRYFTINNESGNVAIGNVRNDYAKLAVDGKILAEELVIKLSQHWADYVFLPSYNLLSLEEVEAHIEQEGHLHNTPSASEIEADGLTVGEITVNQQEKIEELYLHMIEMNENMKAMRSELDALKKENTQLKNQ